MPDDTTVAEIIYPPPRRTTAIKGLIPRLPERGKIKIGMKGAMRRSSGGTDFQPPMKLDHFLVTTLERDRETQNFMRDEEFHRRFGDEPHQIDVRLLYDDVHLNFMTRYACFIGRTLWCTGDGESATRLSENPPKSRQELDQLRPQPREVTCTCFRQANSYEGRDKCKMNGNLSVILDGVSGLGGVWNFRTTSYWSITGIQSSLEFIHSITGGILSNIPLRLSLQPKQITLADGKGSTIYVVSVEFPGTVHELQRIGHSVALERANTHVSIAHIEDEARRRLLAAPLDMVLPGDDNGEVVEEFYPEQAQDSETAGPPTREQFRQQQQQHPAGKPAVPQANPQARSPAVSSGPQPGPESASNSEIGPPVSVSPATEEVVRDDAREGQRQVGSPESLTASESSQSSDHETWDVTNPDDGEVTSYETAAEAEMAFLQQLNAGMRKALHAKPGSTLAKSIEAVVESNFELLSAFPDDARTRLYEKIDMASAQVAAAHNGTKAPSNPPKQPDAISEALSQGTRLPSVEGRAGPGLSTPAGPEAPEGQVGPGPDDQSQSRDIEIKPQTYGPGRGVDWKKTIDNTIGMIETMTVEELATFQTFATNARHIAQLKLMDAQTRQVGMGKTEPQAWARVQKALEARTAELTQGG